MFTKVLLVGALAASAMAQQAVSKVLFFTKVPNPITVGEPAAITYSTNDTTSPVTIILKEGPSTDLKTVMTLTTDSTNSQFVWTPGNNVPNGNDYALEIKQKGQLNYFGPFTIQGASAGAGSSSSSSSAASNMTTTMGSAASMGTGTNMPRNTTMVSPTFKTTKTTSVTKTTSSGAGFQGSTTGSGAGPTNTGNAASSDFTGGSSLALAFGAVAALFYLA